MLLREGHRSRSIILWLVLLLLLCAPSSSSSSIFADVLYNPLARCNVESATGTCDIGDYVESANIYQNVSSYIYNETKYDQCKLYMALSSIPGAGLGIFTGTDRKVGDTVGFGDVMIPVIDIWYHLQAFAAGTPEWPPDWAFLDPLADYVWNGPDLGMQHDSSGKQQALWREVLNVARMI